VVLNIPKKKLFLTGGSGTLGTEIKKIYPQIISPSSKECDILSLSSLQENLEVYKPDIFIHAAAFTDVKAAEKKSITCNEINVIGTANVIKACKGKKIKLVFISTDYVFDGEKGNYKPSDPINPLSNYAKSKAAAELLVRTYVDHLIIRTSFFGHNFPYERALIDQWTTKDYVDIIAPKILKEATSDKLGIIHVGSLRRSIYEIAKTRNSSVGKIERKDLNVPVPKDVSLSF
tara:strand:+ start:12162 stop:12857 length:696 start_codon:yes stop_codon:yes gene_type:complete